MIFLIVFVAFLPMATLGAAICSGSTRSLVEEKGEANKTLRAPLYAEAHVLTNTYIDL
jgi:hypothetical protein